MALPANSEDPPLDQQVMIAQATGPGVLEGEVQGPDYGRSQPMLNGVERPDPSPASLESLQWGSPSQVVPEAAVPPDTTSTLELPIQRPSSRTAELRGLGQESAAATTSQPGQDWPLALRWMSRLNDFFQRAATGSVEMIAAHTSQQVSGSREGGLVVQQRMYHSQQAISPQRTGQPRGLLHGGQPQDPPLFGAEAQRAMEEWPIQAPLLHGPPRLPQAATEGSDRASSTSIPRELVQEEVKRQVIEAMRAQNEQLERLRRENEALRAAKAPPPGLPPGLPRLRQEPANDDNVDYQQLPHGDQTVGHQGIPHGDQTVGHQGIPHGDRAVGHQRTTSWRSGCGAPRTTSWRSGCGGTKNYLMEIGLWGTKDYLMIGLWGTKIYPWERDFNLC